ncbi:MAG: ribonucleotide-diphosphate reductase subunit beta [Paraclostridium sp.]
MKTLADVKYKIALEIINTQRALAWDATEFTMVEDIKNYNGANSHFKGIISDILSYFIQLDVEVSETYGKLYPCFFNVEGYPEIQMLFATIANTEVTHILAYNHLFSSLNLNERIYRKFEEYERRTSRLHNMAYLKSTLNHGHHLKENFITILQLVLFGEGVMLYGMFALLLCLSQDRLFVDTGSIVAYSIRDENLHVEGMSRFMREYAEKELRLDIESIHTPIIQAGRDIYNVEMLWVSELRRTIDTSELPRVFSDTLSKLEDYYLYLIRQRIDYFFYGKYPQAMNPLPFMKDYLTYVAYDFLKTHPTEYAKITIKPEDLDLYA